MLYKMTAIGRMTAIGYRPATGCNIYIQFDHVISCDIELRFDIDATRGICALRARVAD